MKSLLKDQRGSVAFICGLILPIIAGFAAFAIDLSNLYYTKTRIQSAADAAALGAVLALPDTSAAASRAVSLAAQNAPAGFGTLTASADVTLGLWNATTKTFTATSSNPNAVQVATHRTVANGNPVATYFGRFVGASFLNVNAKSVAVRFGGACVRVLDKTASQAFNASGNGSATMNCPMEVDSSASNAARLQGSTSLSASNVCIVGGYSGNGWTQAPQTGCAPLGDPLATLPEPAMPTAMCSSMSSGGTVAGNCTITGNVSIGGNLTLQSGVYYLHSANVTVSNNTNLSGSGVMFFMDSNSSLSLLGGGTASLSAPTSGTYAGVLMFQSRSTPSSTTLSIGGGGTLSLNGTLYAPSATLSIGGNGVYSATAQFGYMISDKLTLGGSSNFVFNAFPTGTATPRTLRVHAGLVR